MDGRLQFLRGEELLVPLYELPNTVRGGCITALWIARTTHVHTDTVQLCTGLGITIKGLRRHVTIPSTVKVVQSDQYAQTLKMHAS